MGNLNLVDFLSNLKLVDYLGNLILVDYARSPQTPDARGAGRAAPSRLHMHNAIRQHCFNIVSPFSDPEREGCGAHRPEPPVIRIHRSVSLQYEPASEQISVDGRESTDFIRASIYDRHPGSLKVTTHLDHISHCKTRSSAN